jgi:hypothetical protein
MRLGTRKINPRKSWVFRSWQGRTLIGGVLLLLIAIPISMTILRDAQAACSCSVFGTPTGQEVYANGSAIETGFKVIPDQDGYIGGVRFYKQNGMGGTHAGTLWTSGGASLATATFTSETASGWQDVTFSSPVYVTAGTTYIASVSMNDGNYLATSNYFTTSVVNGPLTAPSSASSGGNGVFSTTVGAFPTQTYNSANYWIDVAFYSMAAPTVSSVSPLAGSTNIQPGASVTATFDTSMDAASFTNSTFEVRNHSGELVAGSYSYNAATKTVSFYATEGLATNTVYTATLEGGTGNVVKSSSDVALASDYSWSFTTDSANSCPCSLKDRATPTSAGTYSDAAGLELGVKVRPSTGGYITSLRYYKPITSTDTTNTGHIWSSTGSSLATVTFANESSYGWQEAKLSTPLRVYQGQLYIISFTASSATYVSSSGVFTSNNMSSGYLTAYASGSSENAATGSGNGNGVFNNTAGQYPDRASPTGNYYWVDAVFSTTSTVDNPLTVEVAQPKADSFGVKRDQAITAKFNHTVDGNTVTNSTFRLFDSSNNQVAGTASYDSGNQRAVFTPTDSLAYGRRYTAKLSGSVADNNGTSLGSEYAWSFNVGSQLSSDITQGPGGPILVVTSSANNYSKYYAEILRAEGFNEFEVKDISAVTPSVLGGYKAVILSEMSLSQAQVDMMTSWVGSGGNLIAMRPDNKLSSLLGLAPASGTLTNQYMLIDTSKSPGSGLVNETIQYKGAADNYTLSGASLAATLYSDATTSTSNPAVTTREVGGSGGSAAAFTYDLAKSVIALHQGNQSWVGQNRDGSSPVRSNDMFYGAMSGDVQADWVNLNKIHIPQADEQQRLLANILTSSMKDAQPLPHFWYLPNGNKAAVVMAGDDHSNPNSSGTEMVMNNWLNDSNSNCSVVDWECVRASHYIYVASAITDARAKQFHDLGFEIGDHVGGGCGNFSSYSNLLSEYQSNLSTWRAKYTDLPNQVSHRYHCYVWSDWDSQMKVDAALGIRYDLNYLAYPAAWIGSHATIITGSGMNMRFTNASGTLMDVRQGVTNFDDQTVTSTNIEATLDNAIGSAGYYGIFGSHYDMTNSFDKTLFASALSHNVPMISSQQALTWLDGRDSSSFSNFSGSAGRYGFTIAAAEGATGLHAMLPSQDAAGNLSALTKTGSTIAYQTQTIKGVQYAVFDAAPGDYTATYSDYNPNSSSNPPASGTGVSSGNGTSSVDTGSATGGRSTVSVEAGQASEEAAKSDNSNQEVVTTEPQDSSKEHLNKNAETSSVPAWLYWSTAGLVTMGSVIFLLLRRRRRSDE